MVVTGPYLQRASKALLPALRPASSRGGAEGLLRAASSRDRLALSPVAKGLTPGTLSHDLIRRLNARIEPLGSFSAPGAREAREAFYRSLYGDAGLQTRAQGLLDRWVTGGRDQQQIREAFTELVARGGRAGNPTEETVRDLLVTRKQRWERLAARFDAPAPESFHLYRGVRGEYALEELVQALEQPGRKTLTLSNHTVASWSTDRDQARRFADAPAASLIYEADVPIERTLADKWVDGAGLLVWCPEQDEVLVAARNLEIPLDRFEATFRGKTYRAADRAALVADWRAAHPVGPTSPLTRTAGAASPAGLD